MVDTFNLLGVKKFDRRRDNLTKMKNRVKNIMRAKSYQSRQTNPSSAVPSKHAENKEGEFFNKNKNLFDKISVTISIVVNF